MYFPFHVSFMHLGISLHGKEHLQDFLILLLGLLSLWDVFINLFQRHKQSRFLIPTCLWVFSLFPHNTGETRRYQVQYLLPNYSVFPWPSRGSSSGLCDHRATFLSTTPCWFLRITRCKNTEKTEKLDLTLSRILKNLPLGNGKCDVNVRK